MLAPDQRSGHKAPVFVPLVKVWPGSSNKLVIFWISCAKAAVWKIAAELAQQKAIKGVEFPCTAKQHNLKKSARSLHWVKVYAVDE